MHRIICVISLILLGTLSYASQETITRYLSGHGCDDAVKWDFLCSDGAGSGRWTKIDVPSCWELQGFGHYQYGDYIRQKKDGDFIARETGLYRHSFTVPSSWKGKHVEIVFEGVMTDADVSINGKSAGPVHSGAFYRFSYDISGILAYGKRNFLEVKVSKESFRESVNAAQRRGDYWNFGGIFRPVYLVCKPQAHIERIAIDARSDGSFKAECHVRNAPEGAIKKVDIKSRDGRIVASGKCNASVLKVECLADRPELWTAETPNLYIAEFSLCMSDGRILHREQTRFGFRTIESRYSDGVYLNGSRIEVRGVNRHCFRPESGRTLSHRCNLEDALLIKSMNMNAVRCSHYPPDADFLEICDSLGLYVIDEFNSWQHPMSTEDGWDLVYEMVTRDVNHPSILWWTNGNEGGFNFELEPQFFNYDPQHRPVLYPWANRNGYQTKHYCSYGTTQDLIRGPELFMPTEFLHGLYDGGHGAGLDDYWKLMRSNPRHVGGFLWSLADEGVVRHDLRDSIDCKMDFAPDGIVGPHGEKEGSYDAIRQIWCPVQISLEDGRIIAENRFNFINLSSCRFIFEYASIRDFSQQILSKTSVNGPDAAPGDQARIELPAKPEEADILRVTVLDNFKRDLFTWVFPTSSSRREFKAASFEVSEREGELTVHAGGGCRWIFSKESGRLAAAYKDGREISLSNGPRLIAARQKGLNSDGELKVIGSRDRQFVEYQTFEDNGRFCGFSIGSDSITANYEHGQLQWAKWSFTDTGEAGLEYCYAYDGLVEEMGVTFDYPEDLVLSKRWIGNGPYRVWQNRTKGPQLGVWEVEYNDAIPGGSFVYPEFKGFFSGVSEIEFRTSEGNIFLSLPRDKYLGVFTPRDGENNNLFSLPRTGISIFDVIPSVRTKFKRTTSLGPSSMPVMASGSYSGIITIKLQ